MTNTLDPAHIMAAANAAPNLDPESLVAAAQAARSPAEAVGNATALAAYAAATNQASMLTSMDNSLQQKVWNSRTPSQQTQLLSVGYKPPQNQAKVSAGPGLIGGVFNDISHAAGDVGSAVGIAGRDTLGALNAPWRLEEHIARASVVVSEAGSRAAGQSNAEIAARQQAGAAAGGGGMLEDMGRLMAGGIGGLGNTLADFGKVMSASTWSQGWRQSNDGEKTFDPAIERQIQDGANPADFRIAQQLASGIPEQDIVANFPAAQKTEIIQKIANNPDIKSIVAQLQAAKLSPGRSIVGEQFALQHPGPAKLISGGLDAAFDVAANPTLNMGNIAKASEVANWGMDASTAARYTAGNASDYEALINNWADRGAAQRYLETAAKTINEKGYGALQDQFPTLARVSGQLADAGVDSPESLKNWLSSQAGMYAILSGKAARLSGTAAILPHLSPLGLAKLSAKGVFQNGVNFLADRGAPDVQSILDKMKGVSLTSEDLAGLDGPTGMAADGLGVLPSTAADAAPIDGEHMLARKAGGFASSVVLGGPSKVARVFRQMTTLTAAKADGNYIDLADPESAINLKRMLQYSLPAQAVNKLVDLYVRTPDIGQKFKMVQGATDQMLHLAGVYSGPRGAEYGDQLLKALDDSFHSQTYSPLGLDKFPDGTRSGVLDGQESTKVHLPSFHSLMVANRQNTFLHGLGIDVPGGLEKFMAAWRWGVLTREGFPVRVSTDENAGYALRNGILPMIASRIALHAAKKDANAIKVAKAMEEGVPPELSNYARAAAYMTDKVPAPILGAVQSTRDLASAVFGDATYRAFASTGSSLTRNDYHEAAALFHDHIWNGLTPQIAAVAHGGGGYDQADHLMTVMEDGKPVVARWRETGKYSEATASDPMWRKKWQMALGTTARSRLGQSVLHDIDKSNQTQVRNVMKILADPSFADTKAMFKRSFQTNAGKQLGVDATREQVDRAWARTVVAHVNALVRSSDPKAGGVLHDVVDEMKATGDAPHSMTLDQVEQHKLPANVYGPDIVPLGKMSSLVEKTMHPLAQQMDWLSREPNTLHAFTESLHEVRPWVEKFAGTGENADELASHLAAERAFNKIKPFIHNPEIRSQFEVMHRTAMPFLFAQDQFVKRWVKTFVTNPDAIAKAQLGMNGLRTTGVIHRDANGNDFFYYPGSQYVTSVIARAAQVIGIPASVPLLIPFTGQVKHIMPGIANPLTPSVGPTVAIPLKAIAQRFPEMQTLEQGALGPGASNTYWEQILPSTLANIVHMVGDNPDTPGQFASMMTKAIQQLQADGHGLPASATSAQKDAYIRRLTDWTRILFFTKTVLGFTGPASPSAQFDPKNLNTRLSTLLGELPYDQAINEFLKENPNATPYTVFASKSTGGATLASTKAAGDFLNNNSAFVTSYPRASGWLIPRTTGNQPFDPAVYREQIQYGLRDTKTPAQFLDDILIAPAAKTYYAAYDTEQTLLAAAKHQPQQQAAIRNAFDQQKAQFMAQNPTFSDRVTSQAGKVQREQTIVELENALTDPTVPKSNQVTQVTTVLRAFDTYQQQYTELEGQSSTRASAEKTAIKNTFIAEGTQFALDHPEVSDLWTILIRPEVTDTTMGLASTPSALALTGATSGN